ncbi:MAG TPA: hypothetical protein EYQ59_09315 [Planctomycetes bacterium]|jgi:hypothetical protein|nr:hypothetical protein [Planctomycetota bacterium]
MHPTHDLEDLDSGRRSPASRRAQDAPLLPWPTITLVAAVIGLLLMVAIPMRPLSPKRAMELQATLRTELATRELTLAVQAYHHDHGQWPGAKPAALQTLGRAEYNSIWFTRQLSLSSNAMGEVCPQLLPEYPHGPYLSERLPVNPRTGFRTLRILERGERFESIRDGIYGWLYNPESGEVRAHQLPFSGKHASSPLR